MNYQTSPDVSFCEVNGNLIFLDVAQDRYFRLPPTLERSIAQVLNGHVQDAAALEALVDMKLLVETSNTHARVKAVTYASPSISLLERGDSDTQEAPSLAIFFEVMLLICSVKLSLRFQPLKKVLGEAGAYRDHKATCHAAKLPLAHTASIQRATQQFYRARRLVPLEPVCLLDSLSLLRFLARRGLSANLVFGVALQPFAAHCWLQLGDIVINESITTAAAHTPIRIV